VRAGRRCGGYGGDRAAQVGGRSASTSWAT
jgi:hypothetical protein